MRRWNPRTIFSGDVVICLLLALVTFAAYFPATRLGFIGFDDPINVTGNPWVRNGLTFRSFIWAFTSLQPDAWFPVTRLSHIVAYSVFGANGSWHHVLNIAIHAGASAMLYCFLQRATRQRWPSAFVAAVFALHPLHVESVAWISERKDVLCAFFWFAALWAWVRYTERPTKASYVDALMLFAAGLMSKPMIVTLPFVMLVLDFWPLQRKFSRTLIVEKLPFAVLSLVAASLAVLAQGAAGAVRSLDSFPLPTRFENAVLTVWIYIGKTFWPSRLSMVYAWPSAEPVALVLIAGIGLIATSILFYRWRGDYPWLAAGWLWFLITLVPVIGIVQVGPQSRADRYLYIPMTGLLIVVAWGTAAIIRHLPSLAPASGALAAIVCLVLAGLTWRQSQYWDSSETLFRRAIDLDPENDLAWEYLAATVKHSPGALPVEIEYHRRALGIRPGFIEARENLAWALYRDGQTSAAIAEYLALLGQHPVIAQARCDLGSILLAANRTAEAISQLEMALREQPDLAEAHNNLAVALWRQQSGSETAIRHLERALELRPAYPLAHTNLGLALSQQADGLSDAVWHFNEALSMVPDDATAHLGLGQALSKIPLSEAESAAHLEAARQLEPDPERLRALVSLRTDDGSSK